MNPELASFGFWVAASIAMILCLIFALENDIRQSKPPSDGAADEQQKHGEGISTTPEPDSDHKHPSYSSPAQYFLDRSRLVFEIIVAVLVGGYTITQVQQLAVSRDTEKRQLRAYVLVDHAFVHLAGRTLVAELVLKNYGITPAYDLNITSRMVANQADGTFPVIPSDQPAELDRGILGPGNIVGPAPPPIEVPPENATAIPAFQNGTGTIFVVGNAEYRDAFDRIWQLSFRVSSHHYTNGKWFMQPTPEGNAETQKE